MTSRLPELEDDGLITPGVGEWADEKYRLVGLYSELFTKVTKGKWGRRVYIDLFSGAGRARVEGTNKIFPASPFLALKVADKFNRYIFSEIEPEKLSALETRVKREYPDVHAHFILGDTNEGSVAEIASPAIIRPSAHPTFPRDHTLETR
jgi:three-Cys-motif partner protein